MIIGSETWLVNGYKCNDFGYKWNDLHIFSAPLFVYWSNIVGADNGFVLLRCDELQQSLFVPITLMVGFVMVSRVRMIKYRLCFPFQKTGLLWFCNGIITAHVIYVELSMDKDKTLRRLYEFYDDTSFMVVLQRKKDKYNQVSGYMWFTKISISYYGLTGSRYSHMTSSAELLTRNFL